MTIETIGTTAQVVGAVLLAAFIIGSAILYVNTIFIGGEEL